MFSGDLFHQQQLFQRSLGQETSSTSNNMDSYYTTTAFNNNIAFNWDGAAAMDSIDMAFDMARTPSTSSMRRYEYPPALLSSGSNASASSSTVGSPFSGHAHMVPAPEPYQYATQSFATGPTIVACDDGYNMDFPRIQDLFAEQDQKLSVSYPASVDPNLLSSSNDSIYTQHQISNTQSYQQPTYTWHTGSTAAPSPAPSHHSYSTSSHNLAVELYEQQVRLQRGTSTSSHGSATPRTSVSGDEDNAEKGRCSWPDCGRIVKDLKSHMLTHQLERPEKCTIPNCEYSRKGFARKYDKNRHVLTHYKGTMVCGFCPGSGSPAEKSFNRADVFKRHLTSVHNVEQNAPNSKKRNPTNMNKKLSSYCQDATGKCSTCSSTFSNAQEFYEHLEDCILAIVQKVEQSEATNAHNLGGVTADAAVQEIFARNGVKKEDLPEHMPFGDDEDDEDDEEEEDDDEDESEERSVRGVMRPSKQSGHRAIIGGNITKSKSNRKGMTWSKIGVTLAGKGRKRRKDYPPSWGMSADKMKMKKRVLCVYDGANRLVKDDMMLNNEFEVRVRIGDGNSYVTDLDVETVKRANGYHSAPEADRPWIPEQDFSFTDLMS